MSLQELFEKVVEMILRDHVHNINLVTPDHFFPHAFRLISLLHRDGHDLPVVFNLSGYQSLHMLKRAEEIARIYLPDFKYADPALSSRFSNCKDYPKVTLEAVSEMIRQKGFLRPLPVAKEGVLVRHLILPGKIQNSMDVLTTLFLEFGAKLPLSLMSQYHAVLTHDDSLNRPITREEFDRVYSHALDLGFENLYVQFPERTSSRLPNASRFLPDFQRENPFPIFKEAVPHTFS